MMKKILVAVDFADNSQSVIDTAISLAQTTEAKLMLLHVLSKSEADYPILPTYTYNPILDDREYEIYRQQLAVYEKRGLDLLTNLNQEAISAGVEAEYTQLKGNPGRIICELAHNWSAELIIVGSRGLRGLKEIFLGSVSNYVTHHAPCSVLIVRTTIDSDVESETEKTIDNKTVANSSSAV